MDNTNKKITVWTVLKSIGVLSRETKKVLKDGKVTILEAIGIIAAVCNSMGIAIETTGVDIDKKYIAKIEEFMGENE